MLTPGIILPQRQEGSRPLTGNPAGTSLVLAAECLTAARNSFPSPGTLLGAEQQRGAPTWPPQQGAESCLSSPASPQPAFHHLSPLSSLLLPFSTFLSSLSFPLAVPLLPPGLPNSSHLCPLSRAQLFLLWLRPSLQKPFSGHSSPSPLWTEPPSLPAPFPLLSPSLP